MIDHIQAKTLHARRGTLKNSFTYGVDFVLCDLSQDAQLSLFSRNRFNLWSLWDKHHGGPRGTGSGVNWFKEVLRERGMDPDDHQLWLLTQPNFLWFHFNPVSFWIAMRDGTPRAFVAEVNNTFGHRHCYFCAHDDFRPIQKADKISAIKLMHVSPFQKVEGRYLFNFDLTSEHVDIRILYQNDCEGVLATLAGPRRVASNRSLAWAALRRPFGAARVVALIYWQALILYSKRAPFRRKPEPPEPLISDSQTYRGNDV
ncbi:DUF1365 domain-containing protein [Aliiroseovarius sp. 2305UL8-7]|uniref:DUF1365 domain-containing protein n=1 Tax=Aliiroseovarius conchicola TaxID=3121637 RepID=UPI0035275B30